jgi:hypothetical protein
MILSKGNLSIADVAKRDRGVVVLNADGSTTAACRGGFIAVGPVPAEAKEASVLDDSGGVSGAVAPEAAKEALRHIRADKLFGGRLEYTEAEESEDGKEVVFTTRDEARVGDTTRTTKTTRGIRPSETALRRALVDAKRVGGITIGLNRKRLLELLEALDKAAPDGGNGEAPIWLTVVPDGGICLRSVNIRTDQRVLAWLRGEVLEEGSERWLQDSGWEKGIRLFWPRK